MPLARISWLVTVGICLIAALLLLLEGYYGYSGVLLAVGAPAAVEPALGGLRAHRLGVHDHVGQAGQRSRTASSIAPACWCAEGSGCSPGRLTVTSATRPCSPSRKVTSSGAEPV